MATQTLSCIGSAFADYSRQSTNYSTASQYGLDYVASSNYNSSRIYFKFQPFPEQYKRRVLQSAVMTDYWNVQTSLSQYTISLLARSCDDFDESTLTWANRPDENHNQVLGGSTLSSVLSTPNPTSFPDMISSGLSDPAVAKRILKYSCMYVQRASGSGGISTAYLNTRRATNKPILTVTFGSSNVTYKLKGTFHTSGFVNRFNDNVFYWQLTKAVEGDYCVADPVQASAVFHWRDGSSGTTHNINISGSTTYVTVPANTFPGSDEIQWWVTGTDDYGVTLTNDDIYTVSTLAGDLVANPASPINGAFADPAGVSTFTWTNSNEHLINEQTGAQLQYSTDRSTWTTLATVTGAATSYDVPAGTFTNAGTYYWRVRAKNVDGTYGPYSSSAEFSTVDVTMYATPLHPVSEICDYTQKIKFQWVNSSDSGTRSQKSELQTSTDGSTWTTRATRNAGVLTWTASANTFAAGTIYWRVRCYNSNMVAGPWSSAASFIAYGAPPQPSVSVNAKPFATINWQSSGQNAYKITIDGTEYGPYFGTDKSFKLQDYLPDGQHTATVTIQGAYGLWSPAGSVTFTVANVPGSPLTLTGKFDRDASLQWTTISTTADYLIYRDGVRIGHTALKRFTDRTVLGAHEWRVVNRLANGNYSEAVITGTLRNCTPALALLSGGAWLDLKKSASEYRIEKYTQQQTVSLRQFVGQIWPQAEISPYKSMRVDFDVAWTWAEREDAAAFEGMIGKAVIFKAPGGECLVGILSAWNRESSHFYRVYSASVQRIHWRDFIDENA